MQTKHIQIILFVGIFGIVSACGTLRQHTTQTNASDTVSATEFIDHATDKETVRIQTTKGDLTIEVFRKEAPNTVQDFLDFVNKGYYTNHSFIVQKDLGVGVMPSIHQVKSVEIKEETNSLKSQRGSVAVGKKPFSSLYINQFFIASAPQPQLEDRFTIFGQVIDGSDVLERIRPGDKIIRVQAVKH